MPITLFQRRVYEQDSIRHLIEDGSLGSLLVVVPTKRRVRHLTRMLPTIATRAVSRLPIFTLESLATRIFQDSFDHLRIVDESIESLLFNQAIASSRSSLKYFQVRSRYSQLPPGTLKKIIEVIRNLKEVGIYPETLIGEAASDDEDEQPKLRDIITIYSAYEETLNFLHGVDAAGIFKALHLQNTQQKFEQTFCQLFPDVHAITIVGFDEFTEPELAFIQKISSMSIDVSVVLDFQPGNSALFGNLEKNYERFLEMGFALHSRSGNEKADVLGYDELSEDVNEVHQYVAMNLFRRDRATARRSDSNRVTVAKAKDRVGEVELICKLIKQLVADNPARDLSRICVAMYKPQVYTHIMREQFSKYGIPVNITDRFELSQSPVVVSIVGLFDMAIHGFRREDVLRSVSSTYFLFSENGELLDSANLMSVSRELRITAGMRTWVSRIEKHLQQTRRDDGGETVPRVCSVEELKKAKRDMQWLESLLRDISLDQTPAQFQHRLQQLLDRLKLPRRIVSVVVDAHSDLIEKDARAYSEFLRVVGQTADLLEYQEGKEKQHSLKFYVEQVKAALSQERYNLREQFGQGVLVTSIDETRGLPLDVMIVAGLVDGEFPAVYQSEIFFSNKRMKEREQRHSWENRYLFYQAITNWSEHLYLTYPEQDAEFSLVRSSFVDALKNIIEVEEWEYPGKSPFENTLHSEEEYLRHRGSMMAHSSSEEEDVPSSLREKVRHIEPALNVERSRVDLHTLPEYEGFIFESISDDARETLKQLKHRVYSVSQLETYGKCPYQFFAQRLLRLNVMEEFEDGFSPMEKGSVLHEVLFEFYSLRREKQMPSLVHCSEEEFALALKHLLDIAERKLSAINIPDAFWDLEKELLLGNRATGKGVLREFLEFERNRSTSFQAKYFEVGFGSDLGSQPRTDKLLSSEPPIAAGDVQLRGKVDRVELGDDAFAIIDYKTGSSAAGINDIRSGISLQLPIYLYTIEKLLSEKLGEERKPAGGAYYQLRNPVALKVGVGNAHYKTEFEAANSKANFLPTDGELKRLIDDSIKLVNEYVDKISRGKFPLTTHEKVDKVCAYCDYKTICRIQTVRRIEETQHEVQ